MDRGVFTQDPTVPHDHQCGTIAGLSYNIGCGYRWTHTSSNELSDKEYVRNHLCPKCGMGPWYCVVED